MNRISKGSLILFLYLAIAGCSSETRQIWLDDLKIANFSESVAGTVLRTNSSGDSMKLAGFSYNRGLNVRTTSVIALYLGGNATEFTAVVGQDDEGNKGVPVRFFVIGDRKILFESGEMRVGDKPKKVDVNLKGVMRLGLLVTDDSLSYRSYVNIRTSSDWADAKISMYRDKIPERIPNNDEKYVLTPAPEDFPRITSAKTFGATPGNPFLFTITATGKTPIHFFSGNLPQGLKIDSVTGIITGKVEGRGTYIAEVSAQNEFGEVTKPLKIKIGDTIALTPPLGWNGWNSWARYIDREKVISSANAMVKTGLSKHGWTYINIDDAWQGQRRGKYNALQPNDKFPDFTGMIDYIHSLGLKAGIYSTPWISSYAGYAGGSSDNENGAFPDSLAANKRAYRHIGKYRFETNDAKQMADWGIDYLKYDWRIDLSSAERMSVALKKSGRDIFYSLSNSAPFVYADEWARMANSWRTGPDIRDSWLGLYVSVFNIDKWAPYAGPGHWNDPDMLVLGNVTTGAGLHPTRLTPDEQYSHVSLFCLLSAPLLIGCPVEQLDTFTISLLTNDEVIAVDQDPLGKPARFITEYNGVQIWIKQLEEGSFVAGLFNTDDFGKTPQSYFRWGDESVKNFVFDFSKAGMKGKFKIRDLWRQKDLGEFENSFKTDIRHHGVVLIRMHKI